MKKVILSSIFLFISLMLPTVFAGGGMTHMYIAEQVVSKLPDRQLRNLILDNLDAYLVGAYYPDSGYVKGNDYGEFSHWQPFMNAFIKHLKSQYQNPAVENPKLVAFLMGCSVHVKSDIVTHRTFYPVSAKEDFNGDTAAAHEYGDYGIDLLINIDKNEWLTHPRVWWVPVTDLLAIYQSMGEGSHVDAKSIIRGNIAISLAGYGERLISPMAYPYLRWKMPWTAANYMTSKKGGVSEDEGEVIKYEMKIWKKLNKGITEDTIAEDDRAPTSQKNSSYMTKFVNALKDSNAFSSNIVQHEDGSVTISNPVVKNHDKLTSTINQFAKKMTF